MKWIKFTSPNLIVFYLLVICSFSLVLPVKQASAGCSVVQITAFRSSLNVRQLVQQFNIYTKITEIERNDWIRNVVGKYTQKLLLTKTAGELVEGKGLNETFLGILESHSADVEINKSNDFVLQNKQATQLESDTADYAYSEKDSVPTKGGENQSELSSVPDIDTQATTNDKPYNQPKTRDYKQRNYLFVKIFGEEKLLELKDRMLKYGRSNFSGSTRIFYNNMVDRFFHYPIIIIFTFLIFFFITHVLFVLMVLNYSNRLKNYNERYIRIYRDYYEKVTLSFLLDEIDWNTYVSKLKRIEKHKNRKILISILLNFHDNLKGGFEKPISHIYAKLQLEKDSLKSIHSFLYNQKVSGLHELTNLDPSGALEVLPKLLNHPNESVRAEAQKAYILLHPEKPFEFLRTLDTSFSRWTQLSAFNLLRLPHLNVPSFSRYIRSKHHDVRVFCLQMIIYFQQLENVSLIFNLLKSSQELTRFLAYKAINDLRLYDGKALIKNEYRYETEKNKREIVKALCNIGTDKDIDFLEIIFKSESIAMQIEACRTLYFMSPESKNRLLNMRKEVKADLDLFIAHITDSRN